MSLQAPNEGDVQLLTKMLISPLTTDENYTLKLITDTNPIAKTDTSASHTEATFTGYAAKTLTRAGWGTPTTTSNVTTSTYAQQSWSPTTSQTVTGYMVLGATSGKVLWEEMFAAARTLNNGDTLNLTPQIQLA